jgi:hypothetical protein
MWGAPWLRASTLHTYRDIGGPLVGLTAAGIGTNHRKRYRAAGIAVATETGFAQKKKKTTRLALEKTKVTDSFLRPPSKRGPIGAAPPHFHAVAAQRFNSTRPHIIKPHGRNSRKNGLSPGISGYSLFAWSLARTSWLAIMDGSDLHSCVKRPVGLAYVKICIREDNRLG